MMDQRKNKNMITALIIGIIFIFGVITINAAAFPYFDNKLKNTKKYKNSNQRKARSIKMERKKLKYRQFSVNRQLNAYFTKLDSN